MTPAQYEREKERAEARTEAAWQAIIDKLAVIAAENDSDVRSTHCSDLLGLLHVHTSARRYQTRLMWQMRADSLLSAIVDTLVNEGVAPMHHRFIMSLHRAQWPALWRALDAAKQYVLNERKTY